jgi:hypothetical protein
MAVEEVFMRKAVTLRLEPSVLAEARSCAEKENRTLTNFIETAVKWRVAALSGDDAEGARRKKGVTRKESPDGK